LFARELQDLREIGFAEGLPLSDAIDAAEDVLRLECGSMGVAVEFNVRERERHLFRVTPLASHDHADPTYTSSRWRDIMTVLHRRMRLNDND
jgi:hypothetical protein